jgi:glycosyltransferase involved in cell wall biosynthesis
VVKELKKLNTYSKYLLKCVEIAQQKHAIDIIHLNVIFPACIPTLQVIKKLKCPLFITEHWTGYSHEDGSYQGFIKKYYTKQIVSKAHTIIAVSDYLTRIMKSHHLRGNYQVVPNVIDTTLFTPTHSNGQELTRFIHISSLDEAQKNVSGIISAFASALKINVHLHLSIVGEAPHKARLKELTKQLGINSNVTFLGCLMGTDLVQVINQHDALVMFSNYETFCLVIPECFACGKPVITSNVGGIADYMKPELGVVVDPKNEIQLTKSFLTFAQTKQQYNSALIREFAVTHYSKQVINQKLTTLYQLALA